MGTYVHIFFVNIFHLQMSFLRTCGVCAARICLEISERMNAALAGTGASSSTPPRKKGGGKSYKQAAYVDGDFMLTRGQIGCLVKTTADVLASFPVNSDVVTVALDCPLKSSVAIGACEMNGSIAFYCGSAVQERYAFLEAMKASGSAVAVASVRSVSKVIEASSKCPTLEHVVVIGDRGRAEAAWQRAQHMRSSVLAPLKFHVVDTTNVQEDATVQMSHLRAAR